MRMRGRRFAIAVVFVLGVLASMATDATREDRCQTDGELQRCSDACDELAALFRQPITPPGTTTGHCVRFDGRVGCGCFIDDERDAAALDGGDLALPGDAFIDDGTCLLFGRFDECLFDPAEFPGCSLPIDQGGIIDDEGSEVICTEVCAAVDERRQAAAAARPGATGVSLCDFECACRIRDGERCGIASGVESLAAEVTADEADVQVRFTPCGPGDL